MDTPMVENQEPWHRQAEVEEAIKRRILQRTGRRIENLVVQVSEQRLVIRGRTASFYVKQLAIQGSPGHRP
jgi:hypothetical protein